MELVCLSSGRMAPTDISSDLLEARNGLKAYQKFREERLESDPPVKKFHDPMTKLNLKTFANLNTTKKTNSNTPREVILKAHRNLFAYMVIIAQSRSLEMK